MIGYDFDNKIGAGIISRQIVILLYFCLYIYLFMTAVSEIVAARRWMKAFSITVRVVHIPYRSKLTELAEERHS